MITEEVKNYQIPCVLLSFKKFNWNLRVIL